MTALVTFSINGEDVSAPPGVTIGSVLHQRNAAMRSSPGRDAPRGIYCGMGVCFECTVSVDGQMMRACITAVREGVQVETSQ